jgi:hypothetical protein
MLGLQLYEILWIETLMFQLRKLDARLKHRQGDNTARLCLCNGIHKVQLIQSNNVALVLHEETP